MPYNAKTSEITDNLLRFVAVGGLLGVTILAPNAIQAFDKPLRNYFKKLDAKASQREYEKILNNMRRQGLIRRTSEDYEHGIQLTDKGKKRAAKANLNSIHISPLKKWDNKWRMVIYDIPEKHKLGRDSLTRKLKSLGFQQLQRSVWVHPFPCREAIMTVAEAYKITKYITYLETDYIDSQDKLKSRFTGLNLR